MYNPVSTIRLQFNRDFTLHRLEELIPFITELGVRTIYASPIFKATAGSTHGYDVVDPLAINPEIGTEDDLVRIARKLSDKGIGWIQDIVPNHMAFDDSNAWLQDVLQKGGNSEYKEFFDTSLATDFFHGPIEMPADSSGINYRRFFLINGLICLNIQSKEVFDKYHQLIGRLVRNGTFKGLRVDHIDGLYDPSGYLRRLRDLVGENIYIVVEKILEVEENLERSWPIQGTTGYEFIAALNNLFTSGEARPVFDSLYQSIVPGTKPFEDRVVESKRMILSRYMAGELNNLTDYFHALGLNAENVDREVIRKAIEEVMVRCPYYRFYGNKLPLNETERRDISELIDECRVKATNLNAGFDQLESAIIERPTRNQSDYNTRAAKFYMRLMQFTGPLMAKGVEDTLMYTFNRFVAHNEVGDIPDQFGATMNTFHKAMIKRLQEWPLALNATASHDTKRGEDSRMRLNVLTDIPVQWADEVRQWFEINHDISTIDANDEYMIYQSLIATFPGKTDNTYLERVKAFLSKALREAKVRSTWESPNEKYEESVFQFVTAILKDDSKFMKRFVPFSKMITGHGNINSLSQLLLKVACPGIPDFYQGSLTWDLSFVDPDNRRPVDYDHLTDDDIKFRLTKKLLRIRRDHERIFTTGQYRSLKVTGPLRSHVIAFGREYQGSWIVIAAMLHSAQLKTFADFDLKSIDWQNTTVLLPDDCATGAEDLIGGSEYNHTGSLEVSHLFSELPVSVTLLKVPERKRKAGILMPVTSLPSQFAIGDVGYAGRQFADFLFRSRQKVWQVLPLSAIDRSGAYSPYSPLSSIAGNGLLISMEDLVYDGLLEQEDIHAAKRWKKPMVDYNDAAGKKTQLLNKAWENFRKSKPSWLMNQFEAFIHEEKTWLEGFAQFSLLQKLHNHKPWNEWPDEFRDRDQAALAKLDPDELNKISWIQFIFFRQMKALRDYCNQRGIELIGDVPFYIGLNSADVWEHKNVFAVDASGRTETMAGVPPDYFNSEGQVWGMPVFNWEKEKDGVYRWWTQRLRKNLELFDYVRLDHFRAFSSCWCIPAGSKNAINGEWTKVPGAGFFESFRKDAGELRLVAEDLGDIDQDVYDLRDSLELPGMKVLQFGFGADFPTSTHLPHNYGERFIAYPGTHDNNTTRGWFEEDISDEERKHLSAYFNTRVTKGNVTDLFMRACIASHARIAISPMQDVLRLGGNARINKPSTIEGNWTWRMKTMPDEEAIAYLRQLVHIYER